MGSFIYRHPFAPTYKVAKLVSASSVGVLVKEGKHVLACHRVLRVELSNGKRTGLLGLFMSARVLT